ncbi:hypothetical protein H4R33_005968 [Dimargaris cristalligena]|nr:hypothetical protein H4R33_005968 [Dimargaris cristalligena]
MSLQDDLLGIGDCTEPKLMRACDVCRKKKIKCAGEKPECSTCRRNQIPCHYSPWVRGKRSRKTIGSADGLGSILEGVSGRAPPMGGGGPDVNTMTNTFSFQPAPSGHHHLQSPPGMVSTPSTGPGGLPTMVNMSGPATISGFGTLDFSASALDSPNPLPNVNAAAMAAGIPTGLSSSHLPNGSNGDGSGGGSPLSMESLQSLGLGLVGLDDSSKNINELFQRIQTLEQHLQNMQMQQNPALQMANGGNMAGTLSASRLAELVTSSSSSSSPPNVAEYPSMGLLGLNTVPSATAHGGSLSMAPAPAAAVGTSSTLGRQHSTSSSTSTMPFSTGLQPPPLTPQTPGFNSTQTTGHSNKRSYNGSSDSPSQDSSHHAHDSGGHANKLRIVAAPPVGLGNDTDRYFEPSVVNSLVELFFKTKHPFLSVFTYTDFMKRWRQNLISDIFLNTILAITCRHSTLSLVIRDPPYSSGEVYFEKAKGLAVNAMSHTSLDHIQAFILLGLYEIGRGKETAWMYIGIATRMAQRMGLNRIDADPHRSYSAREWQQRETKRRVWWLTFITENLTSLAMNRPPSLHPDDCKVNHPSSEEVIRDFISVGDDGDGVATYSSGNNGNGSIQEMSPTGQSLSDITSPVPPSLNKHMSSAGHNGNGDSEMTDSNMGLHQRALINARRAQQPPRPAMNLTGYDVDLILIISKISVFRSRVAISAHKWLLGAPNLTQELVDWFSKLPPHLQIPPGQRWSESHVRSNPASCSYLINLHSLYYTAVIITNRTDSHFLSQVHLDPRTLLNAQELCWKSAEAIVQLMELSEHLSIQYYNSFFGMCLINAGFVLIDNIGGVLLVPDRSPSGHGANNNPRGPDRTRVATAADYLIQVFHILQDIGKYWAQNYVCARHFRQTLRDQFPALPDTEDWATFLTALKPTVLAAFDNQFPGLAQTRSESSTIPTARNGSAPGSTDLGQPTANGMGLSISHPLPSESAQQQQSLMSQSNLLDMAQDLTPNYLQYMMQGGGLNFNTATPASIGNPTDLASMQHMFNLTNLQALQQYQQQMVSAAAGQLSGGNGLPSTSSPMSNNHSSGVSTASLYSPISVSSLLGGGGGGHLPNISAPMANDMARRTSAAQQYLSTVPLGYSEQVAGGGSTSVTGNLANSAMTQLHHNSATAMSSQQSAGSVTQNGSSIAVSMAGNSGVGSGGAAIGVHPNMSTLTQAQLYALAQQQQLQQQLHRHQQQQQQQQHQQQQQQLALQAHLSNQLMQRQRHNDLQAALAADHLANSVRRESGVGMGGVGGMGGNNGSPSINNMSAANSQQQFYQQYIAQQQQLAAQGLLMNPHALAAANHPPNLTAHHQQQHQQHQQHLALLQRMQAANTAAGMFNGLPTADHTTVASNTTHNLPPPSSTS